MHLTYFWYITIQGTYLYVLLLLEHITNELEGWVPYNMQTMLVNFYQMAIKEETKKNTIKLNSMASSIL